MTPIARIALYVVAGYLMRGGWLPEDMAQALDFWGLRYNHP